MRPGQRAFLLLPILLASAGCAASDPFLREGNWRPSGANEHNLAVMVAQPTELLRGTGDGTATGHTAVLAIERMRADRLRRLPDTGVAQIVTIPGGAQGGY